MHVMLDLETWSTRPNALIISVGACVFDPYADEPGERFYAAVDPEGPMQHRRHIDAGTVMWWMSPERAAAREAWLSEEKVDLYTALDGLSTWVKSQCCSQTNEALEDIYLWGNGAAFDNVILKTAFAGLGIEPFWKFYHDRCYRTIKALAPSVKLRQEETHHNALHDAVSQARHLQRIRRALGLVI